MERKYFPWGYKSEAGQLSGDAQGSKAQETSCSHHLWWSVLLMWMRPSRGDYCKDMSRPRGKWVGKPQESWNSENPKHQSVASTYVLSVLNMQYHILNAYFVFNSVFLCWFFPSFPTTDSKKAGKVLAAPTEHYSSRTRQGTSTVLLSTWWSTAHTEQLDGLCESYNQTELVTLYPLCLTCVLAL